MPHDPNPAAGLEPAGSCQGHPAHRMCLQTQQVLSCCALASTDPELLHQAGLLALSATNVILKGLAWCGSMVEPPCQVRRA